MKSENPLNGLEARSFQLTFHLNVTECQLPMIKTRSLFSLYLLLGSYYQQLAISFNENATINQIGVTVALTLSLLNSLLIFSTRQDSSKDAQLYL